MSDSDPALPALTQAEAEVARWILSDSELPEKLDPHLEALVMAKLMLSLSPADRRAMADDPDCPSTIREALLEGVAADRGDDDHGLP
jgi:hypothetical protein